MADRIDIAYTWVKRVGHRPWCNFQRIPVKPCNCGRTDVLETIRFLKSLPKDHIVTIGDRFDWVIEHPLSCCFDEGIADCLTTRGMINFPSERLINISPGRYRFVDGGEGGLHLVFLEEE